MQKIERMTYRRFKQHYADCDTIPGSYNSESKSIEVVIPEGRMKPSGTRGASYRYMTFTGTEIATGRHVECTIKAICMENAIRRLPDSCIWDLD